MGLAAQVVQTEPLRFPDNVAVSAELRDLLSRMLCKVRRSAGRVTQRDRMRDISFGRAVDLDNVYL